MIFIVNKVMKKSAVCSLNTRNK